MPDPHELLDELPDLIGCFTPDGTLTYVNKAYADYYARTPEQLIGASFLDLVPNEFRHVVESNLDRLLGLRRSTPTMVDVHQGGDADGEARWFRWTNKAFFVDGSDAPTEFVGIGQDITEQRAAEERTRYLAAHDSLTGLINRHTLRSELEAQLAATRRSGVRFGLLYLDLDGLKAVNDRFGHSAGDELIRGAANALLKSFRGTDIIGRVGGDEFVVVCPAVSDQERLESMLTRARDQLEREHGRVLPTTQIGISAGLLVCGGDQTADSVLQQADGAMYLDKQRRKTDGRSTR